MIILYKAMFKISVFLLLGDRLTFEWLSNKLFSIYPLKRIKAKRKRSITRSTIWIFSLIYQIPVIVVMLLTFPIFIVEAAINAGNVEYAKECEAILFNMETEIEDALGTFYNK